MNEKTTWISASSFGAFSSASSYASSSTVPTQKRYKRIAKPQPKNNKISTEIVKKEMQIELTLALMVLSNLKFWLN